MTPNYILVGLPGAGKSTVGKILSQKLHYDFIDTDLLIEQKAQMKIVEIFATFGEEYFRGLESEVIESLETISTTILSIGGGAFQREENRTSLKKIGKTIYLKTTPDVIYSRLKEDISRPLLECDFPLKKIMDLYAQRKDNFEQADIIISTDSMNIEELVEEILRIL